jgi:hypothetical protein
VFNGTSVDVDMSRIHTNIIELSNVAPSVEDLNLVAESD